jgi:uncharacterized protein
MIIRFSVENFRSIKERQELTLVASTLKDSLNSLIPLKQVPHHLVPVAAIYGANASGKTNIIRALQFVSQAVAFSHSSWEPHRGVPRSPFALDNSDTTPSTFEIEFLLSGVRYRYGFSVDSRVVMKEWLYAYPKGKQQQWFSRIEGPIRTFSFGRNLSSEKNRAIEGLTRSNSLYISAAAQNNHEMLSPIYNFLVNDLRFVFGKGPPTETASMCSDDKYREIFLRYIQAADLGIAGLRTEQIEWDDDLKEAMSTFLMAITDKMATDKAANKLEIKMPNLTKPLFRHRAKGESLPEFGVENESAGTMAYFSLLGSIVKTLEIGGVLCIDDLDSGLHPLLVLDLIRNFTGQERNPLGAQLIFNTHNTNVLESPLLRRDQIWFTEKDSSGATHLYPLTDFTPRRNENLKRGYLQGRYGAIPFLDADAMLQKVGD